MTGKAIQVTREQALTALRSVGIDDEPGLAEAYRYVASKPIGSVVTVTFDSEIPTLMSWEVKEQE